MITEGEVTEIFCIADDFCKEFEVEMAKNAYRNFRHYYLSCVCGQWRHLFPRRFLYNRFVEIMPRCFVDSTCIPVIHNKMEFSMKVFKGVATKGKSTMGWYVGFELHLLCNENGNL